MIRNRLLSLTVLAIISITTFATTWDEPWKDKVIKEADSFVLAKIKSFDKDGVNIEIIKTLAGKELRGSIEITDFYHLNLQNSPEGHNVHFDFGGIKESYFFIKKMRRGNIALQHQQQVLIMLKEVRSMRLIVTVIIRPLFLLTSMRKQ